MPGVLAARNVPYNAGDIIVTYCDALIKWVDVPNRQILCYYCLKILQHYLPCTFCNIAHYCSDVCRRKDRRDNGHKVECKMLRSSRFRQFIQPAENEMIGLVSRGFLVHLYCVLKKRPALASTVFRSQLDGQQRCLNDVAGLPGNLVQTEEVRVECGQLARQMELANPAIEVDVAELIKLACVTLLYQPILDLDNESLLGYGLYMERASLQHSCTPNAIVVNIGSKIQVRAIGRIDVWDVPSICYVGGIHGRGERQRLLRDRFAINCRCQRCLDEKGCWASNHSLMVAHVRRMETYKNTKKYGGRSWEEILQMHFSLLGLMYKVYQQFDPRITVQWTKIFHIAVDLKAQHRRLMFISGKAFDYLKETYGVAHPFTVKFTADAELELYVASEDERVRRETIRQSRMEARYDGSFRNGDGGPPPKRLRVDR